MSSSVSPAPPRSVLNPVLDLQVSYRLGVPLIYVKGELDHQTAPQLRKAIEDEMASRPAALVLDISDVPYIDSGGLSLMFDTVARLSGSGWLGVVGAAPNVSRLMEMTGLTEQPDFRTLPDQRAAALALRSAAG